MSLKAFTLACLMATGLIASTSAAASTPLEERTFFRPVRVGLCAGLSPECTFAGLKTEFSSKYVGASVTLTAGIAGALKLYPGGALHSERVSIRPFGQVAAGNFWGEEMLGGGIGADIHLFKSKRLLLQPSASVFERCKPPYGGIGGEECNVEAGGSLSVMAAF